MRDRRIIVFIVAAVLVVVAIGLVLYYVSTADDRAREDVEETEVLVAAEPIPEGTTGQVALDNGWIEFQGRTNDSIPDNAVRNTDELAELVAPASISAKQIITTDSFISAGRAVSGGALVGQIPQEDDDDPSPRQAVAVALDAEKTVSGNVLPGDVVNVIATTTNAEGATVSDFLLEKAPVIGVPTTTATVEGEEGAPAAATGTVILSIAPDDVLRLVTAKNAGFTLWMTLVPRDYDTQLPGPTVSNAPTGAAQPIF